ncbi:MAG: VWA domain-containing protein [Candidatus Odinarchaeia archaeon]
MSYSAEISRSNPTCFFFLIDQSGSMEDSFGGSTVTGSKAVAVADAVNRLIQNLVLRCAKAEGVRDYFYIGVIGYGVAVGPAWTGAHSGKDLVPISQIGNQPAKVEDRQQKIPDGAGGILEQNVKFPTWFDPVANGPTPMKTAFQRADKLLTNWLADHPDCYPPIVINISDGEPTDSNAPYHDLIDLTDSIKRLQSTDGNVLIYNLHLSSRSENPIEFPADKNLLPDDHARLLYDMSSILPENIRNEALNEGFSVTENSRGFIFNSDIVKVVQFLDIGTRATNLR